MTERSTYYHEKQSLLLCAVHAVNNLLQKGRFSKKDFDSMAVDMASGYNYIVNPHRNPIGLGNYDINVIMKALDQYGYEVIWFDRRKSIKSVNMGCVFGFLLNIPSYTFGIIKGKHWIALRKLDDSKFYNLDSKAPSPEIVASGESEFAEYLSNYLEKSENIELFLIVSKEVAENKTHLILDES